LGALPTSLLACFLGAAAPAAAETLAICGNPSGHAFYVEGGAVGQGRGGWTKDAISGGRTTLTRDAKGNYDVVFADVTGGVYSSAGQGAVVIANRITTTEAIVVVAYPGSTVEAYEFVRGSDGRRQMIQAQIKGGSPIWKGSLMVASCSMLNLH